MFVLQDSPFPKFDEVQAEHVVPGIQALLKQVAAEIDSLEQNVSASWEGLVEPLERIADRMSRAWGTVTHLKAVRDSEALRKAYEEVSGRIMFCCMACFTSVIVCPVPVACLQ